MPSQIKIEMKRERECVHSVLFITEDPKAPVTNVYVSRKLPEVKAGAQTVTLTLEVK